MDFSNIVAAFAVVITLLFNWFPNSDIIAELYYNVQASEFNWIAVTDTIEEAVEKKDAQSLALMASKKAIFFLLRTTLNSTKCFISTIHLK